MGFWLKSVQLGSPRLPGEGLRLGTVRYLPRGVRKEDYARRNYFDVWLPLLAPSQELIRELKASRISMSTFARRYRSEMKRAEPQQVIRLIAHLAADTPLSIGCYCEQESRCHRSVLFELIREAGGTKG